jgi:integral membrane protein
MKDYSGSLKFYRAMAFATGVVLLSGTIGLIVQVTANLGSGFKTDIGLLWLAHGYFYLMYLIATINLGLKMRWNVVRMLLVAVAGTIPTMSFVAEHFVVKHARARLISEPVYANG